MRLRLYFLSISFCLFTGLAFGQTDSKKEAEKSPQLKTQIIKSPNAKSPEVSTPHPASHRLSTSQENSYRKTIKPPPSADELIDSYQRKLDSLTDEQRAANPALVEKLEKLIADAKAKQAKEKRTDDNQN
ncbi:MAG: hypothetical protein AAF502_24045 [Bacteroidota bacterium]